MTDGMLMREYLADNDLRRYGALMLVSFMTSDSADVE